MFSTHYDFKYSKTCLKQPLKKDLQLVFKTDFSLMQVKNIAECSQRAFRNTLGLHLATFDVCFVYFWQCPLYKGFTVVDYHHIHYL